jgi:hypothetical protein
MVHYKDQKAWLNIRNDYYECEKLFFKVYRVYPYLMVAISKVELSSMKFI